MYKIQSVSHKIVLIFLQIQQYKLFYMILEAFLWFMLVGMPVPKCQVNGWYELPSYRLMIFRKSLLCIDKFDRVSYRAVLPYRISVEKFYRMVHYCFVHPIFSSFGFWYFGHFSCLIFFSFFPSCPSCLAKCKKRIRKIFVFL